MNGDRAAQGSPEMPPRRRFVEKRFRHNSSLMSSGSARDAFRGLTFNLKRDLVETVRSQNIENTDDIAVNRVSVPANEHFGVRVLLINDSKLRHQFIISHLALVEERMAVPVDRNADVITLRLRLARLPGRQIDLDALHVHLAQAHHHKTREEKEHDVDQRNDLDPRFLVRDGRGNSHKLMMTPGSYRFV